MLLNGQDISTRFHFARPNHRYLGLVRGLREGRNRLDVDVDGRNQASLTLKNYPIQGPIVSGPHVQPFICQTSNFVLADGSRFGPSLDSDCSAKTRIIYLYMSNRTNEFVVLNNTHRLPHDVARTTTTRGHTVNFVVRVETATVNRGIYESAVLHDPETEPAPTPLSPPKGWNRVLLGIHGVGCSGGWYTQGGVGSVSKLRRTALLDPRRIGQGFAVFTNTLQNPSDNCNAFLAGETAIMSKEEFIKTYGPPNYSLTMGMSGGAYSSLQIIDAFPGLFDGALISLTFPDALSIALSAMDAHLLRHYFLATNTTGFSEAEQIAVTGYSGRRAWFDAANQAGRTDPVPNRTDADGYSSAIWNPAVPLALRYDPLNNPRGARPTIWDVARNIYGVQATTGYALRAYDNAGVQYGLDALNRGGIDKSQFLDLNEGIGGLDRDDNYVRSRTVGDEQAIGEAYKSGLQLSGGGGLADVPVFDLSGHVNEVANYHYQWSHFAVRDRLREANGDSRNFIMWRGDVTDDGSVKERAFELINQWVAAIKSDKSLAPMRKKITLHKPVAAIDGCWTENNTFIAEEQVIGRSGSRCNGLWPSYTFPRRVAGGPLAAHILKCQLKPIDLRDYSVSFTEEEKRRLHDIFPDGVCDWSKPSRYFSPVIVGLSYGPAPSDVHGPNQ